MLCCVYSALRTAPFPNFVLFFYTLKNCESRIA